jgi:hypothetical protein
MIRRLVVLALLLGSAAHVRADESITVKSGDFTIEAHVRAQANLIYHLDCIGRVASCTSEVFELPWRGRLGLEDEDRKQIEEWASVRREIDRASRERPTPPIKALVPIYQDVQERAWVKLRAAEFAAKDGEALTRVWTAQVSAATAERLNAIVAHFRPRFERWWNQHQAEAALFIPGLERALVKARAGELLSAAARFYRSDLGDRHIVLHAMLQPATERARSQAHLISTHVVVELEPNEVAEDRVPIIVHELAHHLFGRMPAKRKAALANAIVQSGSAGPAAWNLFDEVQATVIGNILAGRHIEQFKKRFETAQGLYADDAIDLGARSAATVFEEALKNGPMKPSFARDYVAAMKEGMGPKIETPTLYLRNMIVNIDDDNSQWLRKLRRAIRPGSMSTVSPLGNEKLIERLELYPGASVVVIASAEQLAEIQSVASALGTTADALTVALGASRGVVFVSQRTEMAFTFFFIRRDDEAMDALLAAFPACRLKPGPCVQIN